MNLSRFKRNNLVFTVSMLINRAKTTACIMFSIQSRSTRTRHLLKNTEKTFSMQPMDYAYLVRCMLNGRSGEVYQIRNNPKSDRSNEFYRVLQLRIQQDGCITITIASVMVGTTTAKIEQTFTMTHDEAVQLNDEIDSHLGQFYRSLGEPVAERPVEPELAESLPNEEYNPDIDQDALLQVLARS